MPLKSNKQKKKVNKNDLIKKIRYPLLAIFIIGIFGDIFLITTASDIRFYGFLALGVLAIYLYRLSSKFFLSFALVVLLIMFLFFITNGPSAKTEKAAVWFFLLFATGIIRQWRE